MGKVKNFLKSRGSALLYLALVALIYFIVCVINFTDATYNFERVRDKAFWTNYLINIGSGIGAMMMIIPAKKASLKAMPVISDVEGLLLVQHNYLRDRVLEEDFKEYLEGENRQRKLDKYKGILIQKKLRAKKQLIINRYDRLILNAENVIDELKWYGIHSLKVKQITINTIFNDDNGGSNKDAVFYNGFDGFAEKVFPTLILGAVFQVLIRSIAPTIAQPSADAFVQLAATIYVITSYIMKGLTFAEYSINTVYRCSLLSRSGKVNAFLAKKKIKVVFQDNELYKYRVQEVDEHGEPLAKGARDGI